MVKAITGGVMETAELTYDGIVKALKKAGDRKIAEHSSRFFKTGRGEYGEGDVFLGIRVPVLRKFAGRFREAPLSLVSQLLKSEYHEVRLMAVVMLVERYKRGDATQQMKIYDLYTTSTRYINSWDIVDISAHHIVGPYLENRCRDKLYEFAASSWLWERRIAIIATFHYIRRNTFDTTLEISEMLLNDSEDLIHKAVGWMLREIGKRDMTAEENFLACHYRNMPRTMLRYAIEKFPEKRRKQYLRGAI
jgi:3-methyladenine DNA glycosylase AlkD